MVAQFYMLNGYKIYKYYNMALYLERDLKFTCRLVGVARAAAFKLL